MSNEDSKKAQKSQLARLQIQSITSVLQESDTSALATSAREHNQWSENKSRPEGKSDNGMKKAQRSDLARLQIPSMASVLQDSNTSALDTSAREHNQWLENKSKPEGRLDDLCKGYREKTIQRDPPTFTELSNDYSEVKKGRLMLNIRECVRWICFAARKSLGKELDVATAEALLTKWSRCEEREDTILDRSVEDMRGLLVDVLVDIYERIDDAGGDEHGYPIVKAGASVPFPGED